MVFYPLLHRGERKEVQSEVCSDISFEMIVLALCAKQPQPGLKMMLPELTRIDRMTLQIVHRWGEKIKKIT